MGAAKTIGFAVADSDRPTLERLVERYGRGNRSEFLRQAIKVMAAKERADRFQTLQAEAHGEMGRSVSHDEAMALTRKIVKGA